MSKVFPFRRIGLRARMMLCVCIVLAFLVLVGVVFNSLYTNMANDQILSAYTLLGNEIDQQVSRSIQSLHDHATAISYSKAVQSALYSLSPLDRFQSLLLARDIINNFESLNPAILNVRIFNDMHSNVAVNSTYSRFESDVLSELEATGLTQFTPILEAENIPLCFMYIQPIRNVLYNSVSDSSTDVTCTILYRLKDFINGDLFTMGSENYLTVSDGTCHAITPMPQEMAERISAFGAGIHTSKIDGVDCLIYGFTLPGTGWSLNYALPRASIVSAFAGRHGGYLHALIFGASAVIAFILYNLCYIAYGIQTITRSVISTSNTSDAHIYSTKLPEMQVLVSQLNQMLARIAAANASNAQAQQNVYNAMLAKNRAEMAFYRNQINPHFLFNTLECIRSMAQHCGAESVERLIAPTSKVLHYSLYSEVLVTLQDELDNARNYIDLMNCRSMNAYSYRERVDPAALSRPMVPMILQPLFENSLLHGTRPSLRRRMILSIQIALAGDGSLEIRIADNGCGIPPQALEALNNIGVSETEIDFKESIGVNNIAKRLKLADPRCRIEFTSVVNHYTCVKLHIPGDLALKENINSVSNGL